MINCRMIIDAANARSTFNDPGASSTDKELIGVVDRFMRLLYAETAREDPTFFGGSELVTGVAGVWARPTDAEIVYLILNGSDAKVSVVPFDRKEEEVAPRLYRYGSNYYTVGLTGDPGVTDQLTFYFSIKHPNLDNTLAADHATNQLDSTFPDQFFDLPVAHVARYLAVKENRGSEVGAIDIEITELKNLWRLHVESQNIGVKSRFGRSPGLISNRAEKR